MDAVVKFTSQTQGRDRIFRTTQYACALTVYLLRRNTGRKEFVTKLKSLEAAMSAGRKLLRLGNTVNSIEAAQRTMRLSDRVLCLCLTVANVNRAFYFICDNVLWARGVGLLRNIDKERWSQYSSYFNLVSLLLSMVRDAYVTVQLMTQTARDENFRQKMDRHLRESPDVAEVLLPQLDALLFLLLVTLRSRPDVTMDVLKNACDLLIPLDRLGIYEANAGVVAFCGLISSLIGILTIAQPRLKIKP